MATGEEKVNRLCSNKRGDSLEPSLVATAHMDELPTQSKATCPTEPSPRYRLGVAGWRSRKTGFTLLELVISIAIAAILSLSLTMLLNQSYASQKKLDTITHLHERATLFFTQLERDLMGATIPIENILSLETEEQKKSKNQKTHQHGKQNFNFHIIEQRSFLEI